MKAPGRLFIDVSYTRTQPGNVGITRTVRSLGMELGRQAGAQAAVFHSQGFRLAPPEVGFARDGGGTAGGVLRKLLSAPVRRLADHAPLWVTRPAWDFSSAYLFDRLGRAGKPQTFQPGDCLLLADESWNYPVWKAVESARHQGAFPVLMLYDLIPLRHPEFCTPLFTSVFSNWLRRMHECCKAVLCISQATEDDYLAYCAKARIDPLPSASFRLGSDAVAIAPGAEVDADIRHFFEAGRPCFSVVGTIEPRKNHELALAAFERLWQAKQDVRLVIAGRPHEACRALVERLRSHPERNRKLLVLHEASDADLGFIYANSRALLFPSLAEGFGLPLVEARTRGCPVISSRLPALAELADAGVSLFDSADHLELERLVREHAAKDRRQLVAPMPAFTWADSAKSCIAALSGWTTEVQHA